MTRHERLLENYEDAYFALLMEDVAQVEGARLDQLNMELQNDRNRQISRRMDTHGIIVVERFATFHYY